MFYNTSWISATSIPTKTKTIIRRTTTHFYQNPIFAEETTTEEENNELEDESEETPENVVAFSISGSYKAEKSKGIYVIYNSNKEVKEVTLPAGEWSVYVNGEKAGTEVIEKVKDKVTVEGISAMILVKEK